MGTLRRAILAAFGLAFCFGLAAADLPVLETLTPKPSKKLAEGVTVEGNAFHQKSEKVDIVLEPLLLSQVGEWYKARGLENPFYDIPKPMNYILLRVRFENLSNDETLEFVPTAVMFDTCIPKDESKVYELFYSLAGGEKRLATLGKTLYLTPLLLPPGQFIERLLFFEYDEPFPVKKMTVALASVAIGREKVDVAYEYKATYAKKTKTKKAEGKKP